MSWTEYPSKQHICKTMIDWVTRTDYRILVGKHAEKPKKKRWKDITRELCHQFCNFKLPRIWGRTSQRRNRTNLAGAKTSVGTAGLWAEIQTKDNPITKLKPLLNTFNETQGRIIYVGIACKPGIFIMLIISFDDNKIYDYIIHNVQSVMLISFVNNSFVPQRNQLLIASERRAAKSQVYEHVENIRWSKSHVTHS